MITGVHKLINESARRTESGIKQAQLQTDAIILDCFKNDCAMTRSPFSGCPNQHCCRTQMLSKYSEAGRVDIVHKVLHDVLFFLPRPMTDMFLFQIQFRTKLYLGNRGRNLRALLQESCQVRKGKQIIVLSIGGIGVCKSFYRACTGFSLNNFNTCISDTVLERQIKKKKALTQSNSTLSTKDTKILAALDQVYNCKLTCFTYVVLCLTCYCYSKVRKARRISIQRKVSL